MRKRKDIIIYDENGNVVDTKTVGGPKEKKERIPLRKRIGERLISDEPLIPAKAKKVAGKIAAGALIVGGGALAVTKALAAKTAEEESDSEDTIEIEDYEYVTDDEENSETKE